MQEEKNMPTADDFCKALEKSEKTKASNHIRQNIVASRLLNPLLTDSLPKEMNEKLAVFRTPTISECIVCDSIEEVESMAQSISPQNLEISEILLTTLERTEAQH